MKEGPPRKLAVLLHADVVDSTVHVQADETLAHRRFREAFRRLSEAVEGQEGTAHEVRGDALVAEFPSASNAIEAALSFQSKNSDYVGELPDNIKPVFRIGIAMGEVVVADETVTGDAVVLAQRLEQLATPGGVCIQGTAYDTVPRRLPFTYEYLGERDLKGFSKPIRAYMVRRATDTLAANPESTKPPNIVSLELPEEPSIAVLPFVNMSGDPEQEFFCGGMTEDITTALARLPRLFVVARHSTSIYKEQSVDIRRVGREQGVRFVLEGSVRRGGDKVRITAQLIDATTGDHRWAERYDRPPDDIFAVQDEITHNVAVAVQIELTAGEQAIQWAGGTKNVESWECVVRGNELVHRHVRGANRDAKRLAEQALSRDPDYANAWVLKGLTLYEDAMWDWTGSRNDSLAQGVAAAERAIELEALNPDGFMLLASLKYELCEFDEAVEIGRKAIALAPSHGPNLALFSAVLGRAGHHLESVLQLRRAMRLSPVYPAWYAHVLAVSCFSIGEYEEALQAERAFFGHSDPDTSFLPIARVWLAVILASVGNVTEARAAYADVFKQDPGFQIGEWWTFPRKDWTVRDRAVRIWNDLAELG